MQRKYSLNAQRQGVLKDSYLLEAISELSLPSNYSVIPNILFSNFVNCYIDAEIKNDKNICIHKCILMVCVDENMSDVDDVFGIEFMKRLERYYCPSILYQPESSALSKHSFLVIDHVNEGSLLSSFCDELLSPEGLMDIAIVLSVFVANASEAGIVFRCVSPYSFFWNTRSSSRSICKFKISDNIEKVLEGVPVSLNRDEVLTLLSRLHCIDTSSACLLSDYKYSSQKARTSKHHPLAYFSPELLGSNYAVDSRSDLYSLGCLLHHLLLGQPPFRGSDSEIAHAHLTSNAAAMLNGLSAVPMLEPIIAILLSRSPKDRYHNAFSLLHDLLVVKQQMQRKNGQVPIFSSLTLQCKYNPSINLVWKRINYGRQLLLSNLDMFFENILSHEYCLCIATIKGDKYFGKSLLLSDLERMLATRSLVGQYCYKEARKEEPFSAIRVLLSLVFKSLKSLHKLEDWFRAYECMFNVSEQGCMRTEFPEFDEFFLQLKESGPVLVASQIVPLPELVSRVFSILTSLGERMCLLIDDWQFADAATIDTMNVFASIKLPIIIVLGINPNLTSYSRALFATNTIESVAKAFHAVTLEPLSMKDVMEMISDATGCKVQSMLHSLSSRIVYITGGVPGLVHEYLKHMESDNIFQYNLQSSSWTWDIRNVSLIPMTSKIAALKLKSMNSLSNQMLFVLQIASCFNDAFCIDHIASVAVKTIEEVSHEIYIAIRFCYIINSDDLETITPTTLLSFTHELLKESVKRMMAEELVEMYNIKIGNLISRQVDTGFLSASILPKFNDISPATVSALVKSAKHYCKGLRLIKDIPDCHRVVMILYIVSTVVTSFDRFYYEILSSAVKLIEDNLSSFLKLEQDVVINIYCKLASHFCNEGRFKDALVNIENAKRSLNESAKVNNQQLFIATTEVQYLSRCGLYSDALNVGMDMLAKYGVNIIDVGGVANVHRAVKDANKLLLVRNFVGGKVGSSVPIMQMFFKNQVIDIDNSATTSRVMELMNELCWIAESVDDGMLFVVLSATLISLAVVQAQRSLVSIALIDGCVNYAHSLVLFFGSLDLGKDLLCNAESLLDLFFFACPNGDSQALASLRSRFILRKNAMSHWFLGFPKLLLTSKKHLSIALNDLSGKLSLICQLELTWMFCCGTPLRFVLDRIEKHKKFFQNQKCVRYNKWGITGMEFLLYLIYRLGVEQVTPPLGEDTGTALLPPEPHEAGCSYWSNSTLLGNPEDSWPSEVKLAFFCYRIIDRYFARDFKSGRQAIVDGTNFLNGYFGSINSILFTIFSAFLTIEYALAYQKVISQEMFNVNIEYLEQCCSKLATWKSVINSNYYVPYIIILGGLSQCKGDIFEALQLYDEASRLAGNNSQIHFKSIALEKSGRALLAVHMTETSLGQIRNACLNYLEWGAISKVESLKNEFQKLGDIDISPTEANGGREYRNWTPQNSFCLQPVKSYSNVLSTTNKHEFLESTIEDINPGTLSSLLSGLATCPTEFVSRLFHYVFSKFQSENIIVLSTKTSLLSSERSSIPSNLQIIASNNVGDGQINFEIRTLTRTVAPITLIESAIKTKECVISANAKMEMSYMDSFVSSNDCRSIVVVPLIDHNTSFLIGFVILENRSVSGVYDRDLMLHHLTYISWQIWFAVAFKSCSQQLKRLSRFVPSDCRASESQPLMSMSSKSVESAILVCDIVGFSSVVDNCPDDQSFSIISVLYKWVCGIIQTYSGEIETSGGSSFIAIFRQPLSTSNNSALRAAISILGSQSYLKELSPHFSHVVIGIHRGSVVVGGIGSDSYANICYTGKAVASAKRLLKLGHYFSLNFLITESVRDSAILDYAPRYIGRALLSSDVEAVNVSPENVWEVLDAEPEPLRSLKVSCSKLLTEALTLFRRKQIGPCGKLLVQCRNIYRDQVIQFYIKELENCGENFHVLPQLWTGIIIIPKPITEQPFISLKSTEQYFDDGVMVKNPVNEPLSMQSISAVVIAALSKLESSQDRSISTRVKMMGDLSKELAMSWISVHPPPSAKQTDNADATRCTTDSSSTDFDEFPQEFKKVVEGNRLICRTFSRRYLESSEQSDVDEESVCPQSTLSAQSDPESTLSLIAEYGKKESVDDTPDLGSVAALKLRHKENVSSAPSGNNEGYLSYLPFKNRKSTERMISCVNMSQLLACRDRGTRPQILRDVVKSKGGLKPGASRPSSLLLDSFGMVVKD